MKRGQVQPSHETPTVSLAPPGVGHSLESGPRGRAIIHINSTVNKVNPSCGHPIATPVIRRPAMISRANRARPILAWSSDMAIGCNPITALPQVHSHAN